VRPRALVGPLRLLVALSTVLAAAYSARPAAALPLYARQTGEPCASCHTAFPELTPFGRRFKLGGYTLSGGNSKLPPFAVMLQPAFTHTEAPQLPGAAPHFGPNDNFALQQASLFTGGRITDNLGAFIQATYDSASRRFGWDNTDIRFSESGNIAGQSLVWGLSLNNNPSVQDVWNTTPAWRFPYIASELAPQPVASPLVEGALAQRLLGLGAYGFLDDSVYAELSAYRDLSKSTQTLLGVDTTGESAIDGAAPYWRVAFERDFGKHSLEFGTFGLKADLVPQRMSGAGTDSVTDIGVDTQYQFLAAGQAVTFRASWIDESQDLSASRALGLADNSEDKLRSFRASASYIFGDTWSLSAGRFVIAGTADAALYGTANGSPNSSGWILEAAYLPFMHGGPSFWPWLNARIGLQYTLYNKFDGATHGAGANNTLFLYGWIMF
jgi:hypothetical protein